MHHACFAGSTQVVKYLLELRKLDIDARCDSRWTPLHTASREGHEEIVSLLLQYGSNPCATNNHFKTAEILARERRHVTILAMLQKFKVENKIGKYA